MTTRRIRAFKRWMFGEGIEHSDALILTDSSSSSGISVFSNSTLKQGDLIATIPKSSCLTLKTTAASHIIQAAGFDGVLGLSFAVMYERSLGSASQWAGYLQLLPKAEQLPLVWSLDELDCLLRGTELHKGTYSCIQGGLCPGQDRFLIGCRATSQGVGGHVFTGRRSVALIPVI